MKVLSMVSFSVYLLLVYRETFDLCKLILYPVRLLNLLVIPISFLVEFWRYVMYSSIMSSLNKNSLIFYFFNFLIAPGRLLAQYRKAVRRAGSPVSFLISMGLLQVFLHLG